MRVLLPLAFVVALSSAAYLAVGWTTKFNPTPTQVVETYCLLSESGEFNRIVDLTTTVPESFWHARKEALEAKKMNGLESHLALPDDPDRNSGAFSFGGGDAELNNGLMSIVRQDVPREFNSNRIFLEKVQDEWVSEEEAKIRVVIGARDRDSYLGKRDFYLSKINGEWKIFRVANPSDFDGFGRR